MKPVTPKPAAPPAAGSRTFDPLLDALPQPEVVESDSDTAWGLWEDSVLVQDGKPDSRFRESTYKDTELQGLPEDPPAKKPPDPAP
jgi:hypothetical protein